MADVEVLWTKLCMVDILHCERRGQSINLQYTLVDSVKLCEQWLQ